MFIFTKTVFLNRLIYIKIIFKNATLGDFHVRIGSKEYFEILFDDNEFKELDAKMTLWILCYNLPEKLILKTYSPVFRLLNLVFL